MSISLVSRFWSVWAAERVCFWANQFPRNVERLFCRCQVHSWSCVAPKSCLQLPCQFQLSISTDGDYLVLFTWHSFKWQPIPHNHPCFYRNTPFMPEVSEDQCLFHYYLLVMPQVDTNFCDTFWEVKGAGSKPCGSNPQIARSDFFDIWTSKSGPRPSVFKTFDLEVCFAPQRRALFQHLNFKKWSEPGVFCTFWLGNVLRATSACTFSTSELQKVVRDRQFLTRLTWKFASRHNGVHFFDIWASKSGPRPAVFNTFDLEMCFAPQRRGIFHLSSGQLAPHSPL